MAEMVKLELDQEVVNELGALAYRKWAQAFDELKAVREEVHDGSQDWDQFHAERLKNNGRAEAGAKTVLAAISPHCKFGGM